MPSDVKSPFISYDWCGKFTCKPDFKIERENTDFSLLIRTINGVGELKTESGTYTLFENSLALIPREEKTSYYYKSEWQFEYLHLRGKDLSVIDEIRKVKGCVFEYLDEKKYFERAREIAKEGESEGEATKLTAELLLDIYYGLNETHYENKYIEKAIKYIKQNLSSDLSVEKISLYLGLTREYFTKLFKEETGESPSAFIAKERIKEGKRLLYTTDKSIDEIAYALGYEDCSSFIRVFKRYENTTPLKYRREKFYE